MDRQQINDGQIIDRYLQGKLTADEEQAFEETYLADPELLEELEAAERLQQGLKDLHADQAPKPAPRAGWLAFATSPRYGIAASLVAAAALVSSSVLYVENLGLQGGGSRSSAPSATRVLPLVSVRGAANPNVIEAPGLDEWTVLLLDAGFTDYDRYRAVVVRRDGDAANELLQLDDLTPTYEGMLAVGLPGRLLAAGDYEIRLEGGQRDWATERALDELSRTPLTVTARP